MQRLNEPGQFILWKRIICRIRGHNFAANPTGFDSAMLGFSCNRLRVCIRAACWSVDKAARNIFGCRGPNEPKRRFIATDSSRQPTYCGHRGPRPRAPQLGRESDLQGSPVKARCPPKETFLDVSAWSPYATLRLEPKLVLSARHVAGAPSSRAAQKSRNAAASAYDFCVPARVTESAAYRTAQCNASAISPLRA